VAHVILASLNPGGARQQHGEYREQQVGVSFVSITARTAAAP
jgi:hypothetical protein